MRVAKSDLIPLSVDEMSGLIKLSNGRRVHTTFPGGALIVDATTMWCLPIVAEWRGAVVSEDLKRKLST